MPLPDQITLLCRAIEKKGQAEAMEIIATARKQADHILQEAQEKIEQELAMRLSRERGNAYQQARQLTDGAQLKSGQLLLQAKETLLNELFSAAQKKILTLRDGEQYREILISLAIRAVSHLPGKQAWIQVRGVDQPLLTDDVLDLLTQKSGRRAAILPEPAAISGGCLAYSADKKMLLDFSFETLLKRAKPRLRELLAAEFLEGAGP